MNQDLLAWLASCSKDPLRFVLGAFPWEEPGTPLEKMSGPEAWQVQILSMVRDGLSLQSAVQLATASGHGIGKTALVAMLILWAMSTLPDTRGVVTANTEKQLTTKTWPELGKWYRMCLSKDWFTLTATAIFSKDPAHEKTWRMDMIPWSEKNPEAFAGLHNQGRRILVIMDEASAIDDIIWETTEGALTDADTEILWLVFGNPTRSTGRFRECFAGGRFADIWRTMQVDSRTVSFTNKDQIARWEKAYGGDDSDFFRIRVKGQFPRAGEMEFFSVAEVDAAMAREVFTDPFAPLALGVDVARYGANSSVIYPRKGRDARTLPRKRYQGLNTVDLADRVYEENAALQADGIMIDGGGVGGGVVDNVRRRNLHCYEIQFGSKAPVYSIEADVRGEKYANMRAWMYGALRNWLPTGCLPNDPDLRQQLLSITYTLNKQDQIILTSKEDMMAEGLPSPDDLDGLVLTFAVPLANKQHLDRRGTSTLIESDYNPFSEDRMVA